MSKLMGLAAAAALATAVAPARADDLMPGPGGAAARAPAAGAVIVAVVDARGQPVFCTRDLTDGHGRPDGGGGYRLMGLRPGRWVVALDLQHERVDVLVTAAAGEEVVVPPVVARGTCRSITLTRRLDLRQLTQIQPATWSVRFDRTYSARPGLAAAPAVRTLLPVAATGRGHR